MRFLKIEISNIFAYDRTVSIDLSVTTSAKPVVLIWGRNGMGKTSFLNSMKLLFLGVESDRILLVGFPPRKIQSRSYVLGDEGGWSGLINRRARHRAQSSGMPATAHVSAAWEMPDGRVVHATRSWMTTSTGFQESLVLSDGEARLTEGAAASRLEDFMPREFVGFFFFDGEDIKSLAEADGIYQTEFDRLLRITFVDTLAKEVRGLAGERGRGKAMQELRDSIREAEESLVRLRSGRDTARQELDRLRALLDVDKSDLRRQTIKKENLSGGASEAQRQALEERQSSLRASLARAEDEIIERAPADAPMLANLGLLASAERQLRRRLEALGGGAIDLTGRITSALPHWLDEIGLPRDEGERRSVVSHLNDKLASLTDVPDSGGPFGSLEPLHAQRMLDDILRWTSAGHDLRRSQLSMLAQVRRYRRELAGLAEELMALEVGSQANLERYREATAAVSALERQVAEHNQLIGRYNAQLADHERREHEVSDRLRALRVREEEELKGQAESRYILRISAALTDLREGLRKSLRDQLEGALNARFKSLLHDNEVVDRIEVDESYTLTFYGRLGDRIGRSSLSSGLKQLAATALLWAMKDTSGVAMPVAVDTPLGRIDRANQGRMLRDYYPHVAEQVIVLPTDAEIDPEKYRILLPHVAIEYLIENPFGDGAGISRGSLMTVNARG
jgi:DNA sulfur modification protein DndD